MNTWQKAREDMLKQRDHLKNQFSSKKQSIPEEEEDHSSAIDFYKRQNSEDAFMKLNAIETRIQIANKRQKDQQLELKNEIKEHHDYVKSIIPIKQEIDHKHTYDYLHRAVMKDQQAQKRLKNFLKEQRSRTVENEMKNQEKKHKIKLASIQKREESLEEVENYKETSKKREKLILKRQFEARQNLQSMAEKRRLKHQDNMENLHYIKMCQQVRNLKIMNKYNMKK